MGRKKKYSTAYDRLKAHRNRQLKQSSDEIIKSMYEWYLNDEAAPSLWQCLIFNPPTFDPSKEQVDYVIQCTNAPTNLREVLKNKQTAFIFATMRHFNLSYRTRAWEYVQLFLNDYFAENSMFLPQELHKSKIEWKKDSIKFWKGFEDWKDNYPVDAKHPHLP